MKKSMSQILAVAVALSMLISAMPLVAVAAEPAVVQKTLSIGADEDFGEAFTNLAKEARNYTDGTVLEITVPAGNYTANKQMKLWSNTRVKMQGVTITHGSASSNMLRFGNLSDLEAAPVAAYNGFSNIQIEGGMFDGGGFSKAIMQIGHAQNIALKGVTFQNVKDAHMVEIGGCADVIIENCVFRDFAGSWAATTNYEALQFEIVTTTNNHFAGYPDNNDETPCKNVAVTGCQFYNLQRGVGTHTGLVNSYFSNMVFENNTFENITGFAIIATNYIQSKLNNNTIKNCGSGIYFRSVELAHNNFYASNKNSNTHDKYVRAESQILNNTISVTTGYMAEYKNVPYGIQLAGEKLTSKTGTVPAGDFRCAGVTVQGNTVNLNCTGYGIWLTGAVENTVSGNQIVCHLAKKSASVGKGDGIRLQGSEKNTVASNTIHNTTTGGLDKDLAGITLTDNAKSNTVSSNTIKKAKKDGICLMKSSGNKVTSNVIENAGRDGIHAENASSLSINANKVTNGKRNGVSLKSVKKSTVNKNTIKNCKSDGLHLEKSTSDKLNSNKISKSGRDGIHLATASDSCTLTSNKITSSKRNGIALYAKSKKLTFTKNTIKSSKAYGVYADKKSQIKKDSKNKISKSGKRARSWKK